MRQDHCIDQIRQAIICHADVTPMEWHVQSDKLILKTDTVHTCRDFDEIHSWARSKESKNPMEMGRGEGLSLID